MMNAACFQAVDVVLHFDKRQMEVHWSSDLSDRYPFVWLRDNCQCSKCFHQGSYTRVLLFNELNVDAKPTHAEIQDGVVQVTWEGGHCSPYGSQWLRDRRFSSEVTEIRNRLYAKPLKTWKASDMKNIPTEKFDDIMRDDHALYRWLLLLEKTGIVFLKDAPQEKGIIKRIGKRIDFLRACHYGETFSVTTKLDPNNVSYTSSALTLHTDLQYAEVAPGMQMLHCVKQTPTDGGANELVDGFRVAEALRDSDPEAFRLLCETELAFYDVGVEGKKAFYVMSRHPTIELDRHGNLSEIHFSTHGRDSYMPVDLDMVEPVYKALHKFCSLCYDPEFMITYKMEAGDILCINNHRVLHGRTAFTVEATTVRELEGSYIDWTELRSKRRVLTQKLGIIEDEKL